MSDPIITYERPFVELQKDLRILEDDTRLALNYFEVIQNWWLQPD